MRDLTRDELIVKATYSHKVDHRLAAVMELDRRLTELEVRNRKLTGKILHRARVIGELRATTKTAWAQVVAAQGKARRWENMARSLTGWTEPIHPKDTP